MRIRPTISSQDRLYQCTVPMVGLTGGIATGKSSVSEILAKQGHPVICADTLVKEVYTLPETIEFLSVNFPSVLSKGQIEFPALRKLAFNRPQTRQKLEAFIYPRMGVVFKQAFNSYQSPEYIFYDVPLLFEKNLEGKVDLILLVYCPAKVQLERLLQRDQADPVLAQQMIDSQWDIEKKKGQSHVILDNTGPILELPKKVQQALIEMARHQS